MSVGRRRKRGSRHFFHIHGERGGYTNGSQPVSVGVGLSSVRYEIMYADISLSGPHSLVCTISHCWTLSYLKVYDLAGAGKNILYFEMRICVSWKGERRIAYIPRVQSTFGK
jgi:hypothetical protein